MAEGATFTHQRLSYMPDHCIITVTWEAGADGALDALNQSSLTYNGFIYGVRCIPNNGTAPTAGYDLTLHDEQSATEDLLGGALTALSATDTLQTAPQTAGSDTAVPVMGKLTLKAANAGNGGNGIVRFWFKGTIE